MDSVTQNANNFVTTIVETDWQKELNTIQQELKDDTQGIDTSAERSLGAARPVASTSGTDAGEEAQGFSLAAFGKSVVAGTAEIFEQVRTQATPPPQTVRCTTNQPPCAPATNRTRSQPTASTLEATARRPVQVRSTVDAEVTSLSSPKKKQKKPRSQAALSRKAKFNRLEMQISAMQRDSGTYCDDPDDSDGFASFCSSFDAQARAEDIEALLGGNAFMQELHTRLVPEVVASDTFWMRYFFRCAASHSPAA